MTSAQEPQRRNFVFSSLFTLTWIPFIFTFHMAQVNATATDEQWVSLYGNDVKTSGIWTKVREIASNEERLKNISFIAHMSVWMYKDIQIDKAGVETRMLTFPGTDYKNIEADMIVYTLCDLARAFFFLTKGLKPGCAFYCYKTGFSTPITYELKNEVCGLPL